MKVLIIRFSSIGDIVLTTPVVRCLKKQLGAEVHFLTKKSFKSVVENNLYIDKIFTIDKKISEVKKALQAEQYDYVIDLHGNLRSLQVKWSLSARSFTFDKLNWQKWLITNLKINTLPQQHIVDRYLVTVKSLGVENDLAGLDYFIPEKDNVDFFQIGHKNMGFFQNSQEKNYIAFVIGAAHSTKRLPEDKIIAICRAIQQPILLLGGKDEYSVGERIVAQSGSHVFNTCGQYNLNQSASLVKQAACVITHDTGLMHIAAAFQKNIISIWGSTVPEFGMYPYFSKDLGNNVLVEVENLSCRPCSKIGHDACPKGHFRCMNEIDTEAITKAVKKIMSE